MAGLFDDERRSDLFGNPYYGASSQQLDDILAQSDLDPQAIALARQVQNMERRIADAGFDPGDTAPRSSFFWDLLDTLDAPRQGVAGIIDTMFRGDMFGTDTKTGESVGLGFRRGQKENTSFSDILRRHDLIDNPIARGVVGFGADVLTDPLSYLSFGTGAAARAGGRALTEAGQALHTKAFQRLAGEGISDPILASAQIDDAFKALARYQDEAKALSKAKTPGERALIADNMAKAEAQVGKVFNLEEALVSEAFEPNKLRVGLNVPFLGHLTGEGALSKETIIKDQGPIGQALRAFGKAWSPGRVKVADISISDDFLAGVNSIKDYANRSLAFVGNNLAALDNLATGGLATRAAGKIGGMTKKGLEKTNQLFKNIFNQKALIGATANNARLDYLDYKAFAKNESIARTYNALGSDLLADKAAQREAFLAIDGQATSSIGDAIKQLPESQQNEALQIINKIKETGEISDADHLFFKQLSQASGAEEGFRGRIQNVLADPNVAPNTKEAIVRTMQLMDDTALEEAGLGIGSNFLEYYVPHRYKTIDGIADKKFRGSNPLSFLKQRTYANIGEAFQQSGKVADTDLASLLQSRVERSLLLQGQRKYWQRLALENGLDQNLVSAMYKEALLEPNGPAAQALKRYKIELSPLDFNALAEGAELAERQALYSKIGLKDPDASKMIADTAADFQNKVNTEMWLAGKKPLDNMIPESAFGEIGERVRIPGGDEEVFLPKAIANSFKETVAAKDILKQTPLGSTPFGKATISALDHALSFFKKAATIPWPGYWAQNFFGDRFRQAMAGAHAMNPGVFARTHSVLSGKSAIKSPTGMMLDRPTLQKAIKQFGLNYTQDDMPIKQFGLNYTQDDMLGTVKSFADINIDKFLAKEKNSILKNVSKGNAQAALSQLHDKFQNGFDGFFRVSQFVHRFEQGDSIADAMRSAQDLYFNYRDLSPVEQSIFRRFYMFYGYMSKATKTTMTDLVTNPGNLTMQLHGVNALAELFSDPNAAPTAEMWETNLLRSVAANEQLSRVIGKSPDGKPIVARGFAAPLNAVLSQFSVKTPRNFSVGELMDAAGDSTVRTIQKQFASANPMINSIAQLVSGKNLYFDKPLDAEFLRKLPSLNQLAEQISGYKYDELPLDLDAPAKAFLRAVPDGKGRLIADPKRMWILANLVPGMSRLISTVGNITNTEIPTNTATLRTLGGVQLDDPDVSRSYLYNRRNELNKFMNANSIDQRLENEREE